jgi:hypothetical protein
LELTWTLFNVPIQRNMRLLNTLICAVSVLAASQPASGQRFNQIQTGIRVRVTRIEGKALIGAFVGADGDSLRLMSDDAHAAVRSAATIDIRKVEVSRGRSRAKGALIGGLIGLGVGAASGAILGAATYSDNNSTVCTPDLGCGPAWCVIICSKGQAAGFAGTLAGAAGLLIGSVAGAVSGREQWGPVAVR